MADGTFWADVCGAFLERLSSGAMGALGPDFRVGSVPERRLLRGLVTFFSGRGAPVPFRAIADLQKLEGKSRLDEP